MAGIINVSDATDGPKYMWYREIPARMMWVSLAELVLQKKLPDPCR